MFDPAPRATAALHPDAARRIRRSCAHAYVPSEPAVRGYRYVDPNAAHRAWPAYA
jgi:hypothetical protein